MRPGEKVNSVSNLETSPQEWHRDGRTVSAGAIKGLSVEVWQSRAVPLGGPRAMTVRRSLPQRRRWLVGAWCFADHYGPDDVSITGGMDVPPHPHTGLQTVSWLFAGELEHRDSHGVHTTVRPGELNLMTGGHGSCHSEVSTPETTVLHGVQLWVALPDAFRYTPRDFQHYTPPPRRLPGAWLRVFLGTVAGHSSPVDTFTPLSGAELICDAHAELRLETDPAFEHGVLVDTGVIEVDGAEVPPTALGYLRPGRASMTLTNRTDAPARAVLLGGHPFDEDILLWWNFVARSHDEIATYRQAWLDESDQFGHVDGYRGPLRRLPPPPLPTTRLRPRRNQR
jgi:redox-sensitive bicupin YhaK (pirin superfamily)